MKKIIVPENITVHFGLKFSNLKSLPNDVRNNLSRYAYAHIYKFVKALASQFSITSVTSESSPLYRYEDTLLAIDIKKVEDVALVYPIVNKEIQRVDMALRHCLPEKLIVMGENFKSIEFSLGIDSITKEIETEARYEKLNKKVKAKSVVIKTHKI